LESIIAGLNREHPQKSECRLGESAVQGLGNTGAQPFDETWMIDFAATVAVMMQGEARQREIDWDLWVALVDGRPRTERERDRRPVLYVEHGPLHQCFLARSVLRKAAVDATLGPVQCDPE